VSARSLHVGQAIRESVNGRAVASAGVTHCSPHTCRRAFASRALEAEMDWDTLPCLMGYANFTVLQRYLDRSTACEPADRPSKMYPPLESVTAVAVVAEGGVGGGDLSRNRQQSNDLRHRRGCDRQCRCDLH